MSTKTKASSKNKKAISKKVVLKKPVAKKKVATSPAAKTKASASPASKAKKVVAKKIAKPVKKVAAKKVVKSVKKIVVKKNVSAKPVKKAILKKVAKPVKKAVVKKAKPVKKAVAKKTAKPLKKVIAKKVAPVKVNTKTVEPKKSIVKVKPVIVKAEKSIIVKEPKVKAEKPVKVKKVKAPIVKKPIVAPTTFRKTDTSTASTKFVKEPAGKFEIEFVIRASEDMVFEFVSTESGLSEWFCDDVNIRDGVFTFNWDGQIQQAKLVKEFPPISIRYQWLDKNDGSYFEFRTQKDELTNDISLIITDFAADKADEISAKLLWHSQIDKLLHVLGSFF
jgi:uncharacterized protein YndB with AHSA1/START domain